MYHILIVDDEFLVRLGLKTTIDWPAHGYHVVGEASNGKEALEMVRSQGPDIVLVDIKMPLLDGIQFITEAKKTNPDISFIILSNHESFQYAKQAMKLGVSQYLLKSEINADTLLATLESVKMERNSGKEKRQDRNQARKAYLADYLSKAPINTCISGDRMEEPPEGIFPGDRYVVLKYFCNTGLMNEQSVNMLCKMMVSLLEDEFPGGVYCEAVYQMHYYVTLIHSVPANSIDENYYKEKSNSIGRKLKYYFSVTLKGGISRESKPVCIPQILAQAEWARQQCFFVETDFIVYDERFQEAVKKETAYHVSNSKISGYLAERDQQSLQTYIKNVFKELKERNSYSCVHHTFIDFLSIAKSNIEKLNLEGIENIRNKLDYDNWNNLTSVDETESYINDVFDSIISGKNASDSGYSASVRKAIAYMEEFYATNLTLEEIADNIQISKSYLSMLFKQETGINLVAYLNQYRIGKGKKLLATTNLKIYEIADAIGFGSPYYFSKVFRDTTGMQCKEYRDAFLEVDKH